MKKIFLFSMIAALFMTSCDEDEKMEDIKEEKLSEYANYFEFSPGMEDSIQIVMTRIARSTEIYLKAGTYNFSNISILNSVDSILVRGAGIETTKLDFSAQTTSGDGFSISDVTDLIVRDIKLVNSKGDLLKIKSCENVLMKNIHAEWEGEPSEDNGAYGLYPVESTNVTMDGCYARGASDAGIYMGQVTKGEIKNCKATENVAGIEIENCIDVNGYNNEAWDNTGGFLVFDLPGLTQVTDNVKVYDNNIHDNNHENFAPEGNIVGEVPPGTGLMILSGNKIEVYNNTIKDNNSMPLGIINYLLIGTPPPGFNPTPRNVYIHDNDITKAEDFPSVTPNELLGLLMAIDAGLDGAGIPGRTTMEEIIFTDVPPTNPKICIQEADDTFLEINGVKLLLDPEDPTAFSFDVSPYDCTIP